MDQRLRLLEEQADDEENRLMPWPEWRRFQRLTPEAKSMYLEGKIRALVEEILGKEGVANLSDGSTDARF
jgi:hypothetical protein